MIVNIVQNMSMRVFSHQSSLVLDIAELPDKKSVHKLSGIRHNEYIDGSRPEWYISTI